MAAAERVERAEIENVLDRLEVWHRTQSRADDEGHRRTEEPATADR